MAADPYDILGLEPAFTIDAATLQRAYLERSAALHPDHAGEESGPEAAALNEARRTLEDPERRAEALLRRLGGPAREADRSLPPGFLQEIMAVREQMEEEIASGDPARVDHWERWGRERRRGHIAEVGRLFREYIAAGGAGGKADPALLSAVRRELNVWRYTERLLEQVDPERSAGM